jgi:two-component system cell cycle sensor histidine kinase/response regulator CckA
MNLISNAAEAQPEGGTIRISTQNRHLDKPLKGYDQVETGNYIVLSVMDTGMGTDPEGLKRIFEPFFTKKVMGRSGTGLGMAVVWGTVQDHEGYIDIISTIDKGTTFELYFPISVDKPIMETKPFSLDDYKGNGEKILIVDDVKEQRQIAGIALEKLGYETVCVESGEAAIEYLKNNTVDLLLLDMIMASGINGLETYKRILDFKPKQKAIIASGFSQTRQVKEVLELCAGQYLKKPYTIEKIGVAVKKEISKKTDPKDENQLKGNPMFHGDFFKHDNNAGCNPIYNIDSGIHVGR